MKKGTIVFTDIDGTLLNTEHRITEKTRYAIQELKKKEIPFVIVSARSPSGIYPILEDCGCNCPIIAYSGGLILNEKREILFHKGMHKDLVKRMICFMEEEHFDLSYCIFSIDDWVVKDRTDPRIREEERIVRAQSREGTIDSIQDHQINKILCICNPKQIGEIEQKLKQAFPECSIAKSSDYLLEIMESGITKATAVHQLCQLWGYDVKETIAFGDNYNDVEMLKEVGTGWLMGNAPKELKQEFQNITEDNDHDGIYYALMQMKLLKEQGKEA